MILDLVRGIDFQLVDDPDPDYKKWIEDANIGAVGRNPIWNIMDWIIEDSVRCEGLLGGLEHICEAIEDYCVSANIQDVPQLYRYIFDARGGFLTQSKAIYYLRDDWIDTFPTEHKPDTTAHPEFLKFLQQDTEMYKHALQWYGFISQNPEHQP